MTPDEIRTHPLFSKLNDRQQIFVNALLSNGNDKLKAAHEAWNCSGDESARTLANRALQNESVSFLIESYFGKDPLRVQFTKEGALEFASQRAREATDPKIALDYLKLIVGMNGWLYKPAENDPKPPHIDDSDEEFKL